MANEMVPTLELDHSQLLATVRSQCDAVDRRFPGRGLAKVARQVHEATAHAPDLCDRIVQPLLVIRGSVAVLGLGLLAVVIFELSHLEFSGGDGWAVLEGVEAGISTVVYTGLSMIFLISIELRRRRKRALEALQELRALAHVLDMHQMNKDPELLILSGAAELDAEKLTLTPFLLERYFDYTADLLSMVGKLAAWYAQRINDAEVLTAVNEIESLTGSLSLKIWQKIQVLNQVRQHHRLEDDRGSALPG